MIVGRELEILNGLFSNVGVGDFLALPFQAFLIRRKSLQNLPSGYYERLSRAHFRKRAINIVLYLEVNRLVLCANASVPSLHFGPSEKSTLLIRFR